MIAFQRILFPVDFSEQNNAIVPVVKAMARRFHAELTLLHVVDLPPAFLGSPEAASWAALINAPRLREEGAIALNRFIARHFPDMHVVPEVDEGDAASLIVDHAHDNHAGLIMMPTRGYGPFRALLLGSTTAKVLHDVHCPVWTGVHAEQMAAHPPERWKNMLCAIDTDPRDAAVLRWSAEFAAEQGLQMRLVHAVQGAGSTLTRESDPSMYAFLFNVAREAIARMQAEARTKFEVCLLGGGVSRAVHQAAIGHNADLVVIGRGVLQKKLGRLRSAAYSIIREAPCPVISI
ncbi:MAG TPA: universal stress protein [Bryobacteraceae bacterium]|nr:universal stress protein [Bryobacteraceae bacterium]